MDELDRRLVNTLQGDFPICEHPYAEVGFHLDMTEEAVIQRLGVLLRTGALSRFGPMYHAERLGGGLTLAALAVPAEDFDAVAEKVNAHPEVAHNYARDHRLNMWFVIATERPERITEVIAEIEAETGLQVLDMPKVEEFFVGLRFEA
jgi:DNA-binding Lrp family transcriptional regulator